MPIVRFIRHAESAANAGAITSDPATIPLTERGHQQARQLAETFTVPPDEIVCSPFLRVRQTAAPTIKRFPSVPVEEWPVEEFTYLSPAVCVSTTAAERRPMVEQYWDQADPHFCHGPGAESFADFINRVQSAINRLAALPHRNVAFFGHGQFIQAVRWLLSPQMLVMDRDAMREFRTFDVANIIPNAAIIVLSM